MADQLQLRGGTTSEHATFTGALREVTVDTDKDTVVVHDNATVGGFPLLRQDLSNLPAGTIDNADINASAAIAGTKISPDFGSQTVTTTGVISSALGAAATPSITFTGDPNTGIYSPGADQLAVATNGVERVEFGTSEVVFNDGGANYDFRIEGDTNANLFFVDASAEAVGIGTSSPEQLLHVSGSNSGANFVGQVISNIANPGSPGSSTELRLQLSSDGASGNKYVGLRAIGTANFNNKVDLGIYTLDGTNDAGISNTEKVRITGNGLVGIGTTTVSDKLHVAAGNITLSYADGSTGLKNKISWRTESPFFDETAYIAVNRTGASGAPADIVLATGGAGTATEKVRIDSSGRLLVGTPTARTNIFNTVAAKLFQVESNTGTAGASLIRSSADGGSAELVFGKSRSASVGGNTIVQSGDAVGSISFQGNDGSEFVVAASITAEADGAPGANDMPGRIVLATTAAGASSPTERVRVDSSGNLLIGGTYTTWLANYVGAIYGKGGSPRLVLGRSDASDGTARSCAVFTNGNVQNTNNSYGAISDIKLKENIVDANSQWDDLKALQVRNYNFKEGQTHTQLGLIAQEVELVSPGLVSESPDRDEDGNDLGTVTKSVNYSVLYMKAVKALQEAMERIETLEASNTDLLARVSALESA
jgi:hypothetical protein